MPNDQPDMGLTRDQVRDYLARHPDFLKDNADLLRTLTPPELASGDNVVDFQRHMILRLQAEVEEFGHYHGALVAASRSNLVSQQQIHRAVLAALEPRGLDHFVHTISYDWVDILGVDAVVLCVEDPFPADASFVDAGIQLLDPGDVSRLLGQNSAILLRDNLASASRDVFGPAATLVRAEALVRLPATPNRPEGLLGFGSHDPEYFMPGQGTELIRFLGTITARLLDQWIDEQKRQPVSRQTVG